MKKQEKIKSKLEETEGEILGAFLIFVVVMLVQFIGMIFVAQVTTGASSWRATLSIIVLMLFCFLLTQELLWFVDYVGARMRALWNVIYIALHQDKDIDFVGEKEKEVE